MTEINTRVQVLAVSPIEADALALSQILSHSAWEFDSVSGVGNAAAFLRHKSAQVILCERTLPDGDWTDVLNLISGLADPPQLIVTSRDADDRLWAEVLNVGAYDVLVKPFHPKEVFRTIGLAWRHWMSARKSQLTAIPRRGSASEQRTSPLAAAAR
jgi:DNA-binding response OmpR family regulator